MSIQGISKSDNSLLNSQNLETWKNRFSWETNSDNVKNLEKTFRERELSKIAQSRKGCLANLTRRINRAVDLLRKPNNFSDIALISEKLEFDLFKLEGVINECCKYASRNQQVQVKTLLLDNKTRGEIAIKQCKQYLDREEILSQFEITNLSMDEFFDGSSYSSSPESSSGKESVAEILDIKGSTKFDTAFIKRRELVEKELLDTTERTTEKENTAQVLEKLNKNKGSLKLSQENQKILDAKKYHIEPDTIVRPSISYFLLQNPGRHFNENRHKTTLSSTPLKSKNEKYKQRNSTPFHNPVNTSPTNNPKDTLIPGKEPIMHLLIILLRARNLLSKMYIKYSLHRCYCKDSLKLKTCLLLIWCVLTAILNNGQTLFKTLNTVCTLSKI